MRVLGLSAFHHDSAAVLVEDGRIVAAAQEERFTRKKHDAGFPANAVAYCMAQAGCRAEDVDCVAMSGLGEALPPLWAGRLAVIEPAMAHAASAFFPSPFADAAVLVVDGMTDWGMGSGNRLALERCNAHSLGTLYSAITHYIGFRMNSGEYKVMGLAPYGTPKYAQRMLDTLLALEPGGGFAVNGPDCSADALAAFFGEPIRHPDSPLSQFHMDMAASVQAVTELALLGLARAIRAETGARNLCLGGGVALNCVANGKLLRDGIFDHLWVQPAAGEAGGALGAALAVSHLHHGLARQAGDAMNGCSLGPAYDDVQARLAAIGAIFTVLTDDQVMQRTAQALAQQKAVGWVQGRMEFGPRALGNRSILGDPRSPSMQKILNLKVKYRESFRPFAPSVLSEDAAEWFELDCPSPYMLLVAPVAEQHRGAIPAVTHVDNSARVQSVHADSNPRYHALISAFKARTGCPVLVNTSFNVRGEPMVNTPEDAFRCFMGSEIEVLVVGNCLLRKEDQDPALKLDYENAFELD